MRAVFLKQSANFLALFVLGTGILAISDVLGGRLASALHVSKWFIGLPLFMGLISLLMLISVKLDPTRWR